MGGLCRRIDKIAVNGNNGDCERCSEKSKNVVKEAREIEKISDFETVCRNELLHLLLSHQGLRENGSPVLPMSKEAFVLYFADELDSKMGAIDRIEKREKEPGRKWSNYVKLLDRFLYFGEDA